MFKNVKKNWKNSYGFLKMKKFIWNEKGIFVDYLLVNYFFFQSVCNSSAWLCKMNVLDIFNMVNFFKNIFIISWSTESPIQGFLTFLVLWTPSRNNTKARDPLRVCGLQIKNPCSNPIKPLVGNVRAINP